MSAPLTYPPTCTNSPLAVSIVYFRPTVQYRFSGSPQPDDSGCQMTSVRTMLASRPTLLAGPILSGAPIAPSDRNPTASGSQSPSVPRSLDVRRQSPVRTPSASGASGDAATQSTLLDIGRTPSLRC